MQFQAGSNKLAKKQDSEGDQGFGGTWALWRTASGHPPYRMDDPDDEIAAAAAKLRYDAGPTLNWAKALYQYNALGAYVSLVLKREKQYRLGTCAPRHARRARRRRATPPRRRRRPRRPRCRARPSAALLDSSSIELAGRRGGRPERGHRRRASRRAARLDHAAALDRDLRVPHRSPKFVAGTTKVSNNWYGRGTTITWVDGKAVSPGSAAARALWQQLRTAPAAIRPSELGAPWADPANPRYYSGADALNLIHIGFDGPDAALVRGPRRTPARARGTRARRAGTSRARTATRPRARSTPTPLPLEHALDALGVRRAEAPVRREAEQQEARPARGELGHRRVLVGERVERRRARACSRGRCSRRSARRSCRPGGAGSSRPRSRCSRPPCGRSPPCCRRRPKRCSIDSSERYVMCPVMRATARPLRGPPPAA